MDEKKPKDLDQQIDQNLRRAYQELTDQPVPDRFAKLLDQLRNSDDEQDASADGEDAS